MLEIKDQNFLLEIAADAVSQAQLNLSDEREVTRWVNAIVSGLKMLEDNWAFITWQEESKSLLILSESNRIYSANGTCQCLAYTEGLKFRNKPYPCRHRALARLVRLYFELQERPQAKRTVEVPLGQGQVAIIDAEDAERVLQYKWTLFSRKDRKKQTNYAVRYFVKDGKRTSQGLHRFIMNEPEGLEVDHKNGDGLDNRKLNLRTATRAQNAQNATRTQNRTGFKGVYFHKGNKLFHACIQANNKKFSCGYFDTAEEAARAYDKKAKELHGEFALLNFPDELQAKPDGLRAKVESANRISQTVNAPYLKQSSGKSPVKVGNYSI